MTKTAAAIALIKKYESCRLRAYRDSVGVPTIGWGHTSKSGPPGLEAPSCPTESLDLGMTGRGYPRASRGSSRSWVRMGRR